MGGFEGKRVIEIKGRWALEQLGPIELCLFEAELASALGESLRQGLRLALAFLGEETQADEGPWQKLERVFQTLEEDPRSLVGSLMDRDILADGDRIAGTLVDMLKAVTVYDLRRIAETMLVRRPGRLKGGLSTAIAPGQPPNVPVESMADLEGLLAEDPHEFWRLVLWGLELNLRPLIAASGIALGRGDQGDQATPSPAPTPNPPGASTS